MKKTVKYDADYITYVETGESAAVFIIRDIVNSINTKGKWVDVLSTEGEKNEDNCWDFKEIVVEIFLRKKHPVYPDNVDADDKKYITWKTAHEDIIEQRRAGVKGIKYKVFPKLINRNKGKYTTEERIWNKTFCRYVPKEWKNSSCIVRKCRVPMEAKWEYHIIGVSRL